MADNDLTYEEYQALSEITKVSVDKLMEMDDLDTAGIKSHFNAKSKENPVNTALGVCGGFTMLGGMLMGLVTLDPNFFLLSAGGGAAFTTGLSRDVAKDERHKKAMDETVGKTLMQQRQKKQPPKRKFMK